MEKTKLKEIRDYLYELEYEFELLEPKERLTEQAIQVYQKTRALLNIYQQIVENGRLFDEDYLKKYL